MSRYEDYDELSPRRHNPTCIYLHTDRYAAMADFIVERYGFDVPITYRLPMTKFLPDTNRGLPVNWRSKSYKEGGMAWPDRTLVTTLDWPD